MGRAIKTMGCILTWNVDFIESKKREIFLKFVTWPELLFAGTDLSPHLLRPLTVIGSAIMKFKTGPMFPELPLPMKNKNGVVYERNQLIEPICGFVISKFDEIRDAKSQDHEFVDQGYCDY